MPIAVCLIVVLPSTDPIPVSQAHMAPFGLVMGILSLCIFCIEFGTAAQSGYTVVEQLRNVPDGWIKRDAAPASELVRFRLAMNQERAAEFE